jgi:hypothetical protein
VTRPPCWPRGDKALCARTATLRPPPPARIDGWGLTKIKSKNVKNKTTCTTAYQDAYSYSFHALHADSNHVIMIINANHLILLYNTENYYVCSPSLDLDSFSNLSYGRRYPICIWWAANLPPAGSFTGAGPTPTVRREARGSKKIGMPGIYIAQLLNHDRELSRLNWVVNCYLTPLNETRLNGVVLEKTMTVNSENQRKSWLISHVQSEVNVDCSFCWKTCYVLKYKVLKHLESFLNSKL